MRIKAFVACLAISMGSTATYADGAFITNVYSMVNAVYENEWPDPQSSFLAIRGGGFRFDGMSDSFSSLCAFVSNRCDEIVAVWPAFETNEVARFTLQSAIGFTGFSNQTNLAVKVLSMCENDNESVSARTLRMVRFPYGTPPEAEDYLALNIDVPGVSNIVTRLKNVYISRSETNSLDVCDEILSGAKKQWLLEMKAAGAL